jgi:hypothetical protein
MLINLKSGVFTSLTPTPHHQIMRLAIPRTILQSPYRFSGLRSSVSIRNSFLCFQTPAKNMSGVSDSQPNGARPQKPKAPGKKEVKILMLHGESSYTPDHCLASSCFIP